MGLQCNLFKILISSLWSWIQTSINLGEIGFIDQSRETFSVYNTADNFSSMITLIGIEYTKYNSFTQVTLQTFVVNSVE